MGGMGKHPQAIFAGQMVFACMSAAHEYRRGALPVGFLPGKRVFFRGLRLRTLVERIAVGVQWGSRQKLFEFLHDVRQVRQ